MKTAVKVIIGLLTAWVVIYPFLAMVAWFGFIFSFADNAYQSAYTQPTLEPIFPAWFFLPFILFICSSFLQIGLEGFYIVHNIVNRNGSDVIRAVLGVGMLFLPFIALPIYYFVYILPKYPPNWALNQPSGQSVVPVSS